jgi:2-keto-4-pentenoate hydratase/2-oxohepta-3-ene-1,7-dioic acid hydratase in catechol pathway
VKLAVRRAYLGDRLCFPDVIPHRLLDVQATYARQLEVEGSHRDDAIARSRREILPDLPALLQADPHLTVVRRAHDWAMAHADTGELSDECTWPYDPASLGPPIGAPRTIWGMTANYERQRRAPASPTQPRDERPTPRGFLKAPSSLAGPYDDVVYPDVSRRVDPEMELAVVVGSRSRGLRETSAMKAVAGYVGFCDISARDIAALDDHRMDRGKGFDTFGIVGPFFVTADEIPDPHNLRIRYWVNGELRQDGNTAEMFHSIPEQLCWLTAALTLAPGDVLSTGTPPGVSSVEPGDELRGDIDGLGIIENTVVRERAHRRPSARSLPPC